MNTKNSRVVVVLAALLALLTASSCVPGRAQARVGELQTRSQSIALDGAQSERVEIAMAVGELAVSGGASELLDAKFTYNVAELEPQVAHSSGTLSVRTPGATPDLASLANLGDYRYAWDLQFNDHVPLEMRVQKGAGSAHLKLGSLALTRLDVDTGAGPATVDLTGDLKSDLDARIKGGVGDITVRLPRGACVRVGVEGGVGKVDARGLMRDGKGYVSDSCGEPGHTLHLDVSAGIGSVRLEMGA